MSGYRTAHNEHSLGYNRDPPFAEYYENRLAPIRFNQSQNYEHEPLPYISPYSLDIHPESRGSSHAQNCGTTAYSPYEGPPHVYMFRKDEQSQSYRSSSTYSSTFDKASSSTENQLEQSTGDAVDQYEASLAAVNGIIIPSPHASDEQPLKLAGTPFNIERPAKHLCPICGAGYNQKYEIGSHFVACVGQNGNPDGVCWDDGFGNTEQSAATQQSKQVIGQTVTTQQAPQRIKPPITIRQGPLYRSERKTKFDNRLRAVSGVVIPSKLPPGKSPQSVTSQAVSSTSSCFLCPLCKSPFARKDHVKSHFATCVDRYGNPEGLRWHDGLPTFKRGPRGPPYGPTRKRGK